MTTAGWQQFIGSGVPSEQTCAANFHWLELPPLAQPLPQRSGTRGANHDPLAELLEAITAEKPTTRDLTPAAYPSREWVTAQVEVRVKRS